MAHQKGGWPRRSALAFTPPQYRGGATSRLILSPKNSRTASWFFTWREYRNFVSSNPRNCGINGYRHCRTEVNTKLSNCGACTVITALEWIIWQVKFAKISQMSPLVCLEGVSLGISQGIYSTGSSASYLPPSLPIFLSYIIVKRMRSMAVMSPFSCRRSVRPLFIPISSVIGRIKALV